MPSVRGADSSNIVFSRSLRGKFQRQFSNNEQKGESSVAEVVDENTAGLHPAGGNSQDDRNPRTGSKSQNAHQIPLISAFYSTEKCHKVVAFGVALIASPFAVGISSLVFESGLTKHHSSLDHASSRGNHDDLRIPQELKVGVPAL
jgi:hypothetical protein